MKRKRSKPDEPVLSKSRSSAIVNRANRAPPKTLSPVTTNNLLIGSPTNPTKSACSSSSVILREVPIRSEDIDIEDVIFYAKHIGIDPLSEPQLLPIAQAGLLSPLPPGWLPVEDHKGRLYYFDVHRGQSSWEHPNDLHYRQLVRQFRRKALANRSQAESLSVGTIGASGGAGPSGGGGTMSEFTNSSFSLSNLHFFEDYDEEGEDKQKSTGNQGSNDNARAAGAQPATKDKLISKETSHKISTEEVEEEEVIEEVDDDDQIESVELDIESELIEEIEDDQSDNNSEIEEPITRPREPTNCARNTKERLADLFDSLDNQEDDQMNNLVNRDPFAVGNQTDSDLEQMFGFKHSVEPVDKQRPKSAMANHRPQQAGSTTAPTDQQSSPSESFVNGKVAGLGQKQLSVLEEGEEEEILEEFDEIGDMVDDFEAESSSQSSSHNRIHQKEASPVDKPHNGEVHNYDQDEFEEDDSKDEPKPVPSQDFQQITAELNQQIKELRNEFRQELNRQNTEIQQQIDRKLENFKENLIKDTGEMDQWTKAMDTHRKQIETRLADNVEQLNKRQNNAIRLAQQTMTSELETKTRELDLKLSQQMQQLNTDLRDKFDNIGQMTPIVDSKILTDLVRKESSICNEKLNQEIAELRRCCQNSEANYQALKRAGEQQENRFDEQLIRLEERMVKMQNDEQLKRREELKEMERNREESAAKSEDTTVKVAQKVVLLERNQLDRRLAVMQNQIDQLVQEMRDRQQNTTKKELQLESTKPETKLKSHGPSQKTLEKEASTKVPIEDARTPVQPPIGGGEDKVLLQNCVNQLNEAIQLFRLETGERQRSSKYRRDHHHRSSRKQTVHNSQRTTNNNNKKIRNSSKITSQQRQTPSRVGSSSTSPTNLSTCSTATAAVELGPDPAAIAAAVTAVAVNSNPSESEQSFPEEYHYRQSSSNRWKPMETSSSSTVHKRISRSTPNLDQPNQRSYRQSQPVRGHSQLGHSNIQLNYRLNNNSLVGHRQSYSSQNLRMLSSDHGLDQAQSSSGSLIRLIQQTSNQLKREINDLQKLGSSNLDSREITSRSHHRLTPGGLIRPTVSLGSISLQLTESLVPNFAAVDQDHDPEPQDEDDRVLVQKLKSIRNSVNQRLQKISLAIEQQKTTQI